MSGSIFLGLSPIPLLTSSSASMTEILAWSVPDPELSTEAQMKYTLSLYSGSSKPPEGWGQGREQIKLIHLVRVTDSA